MEIDSSMATDTDHDPATGTRHDQANGTALPPFPAEEAGQQRPVVVGPKPAPTYSVVDAVIEGKDDGPTSRCGHTFTAIAAVGEEGTPGHIGPRLILFGGATALEGNSAAPPSPAASAGIRT